MAARHFLYMSNRMGETIAEANLQRLSDELYEKESRRANQVLRFEMEATLAHAPAMIALFRENMNETKKKMLETIIEGETLTLAPQGPEQESGGSVISAVDQEHIARFEQLLVTKQVKRSFQERLREIIGLYSEKAAECSVTNRTQLAWELFLLREEVEAHSVRWQEKSRWRISRSLRTRHSLHEIFSLREGAIVSKIRDYLRSKRIPSVQTGK